MVIALLKALIAIPKIGEIAQKIIELIMMWRKEQLRKELEAASTQLKAAKTKEERRAAIDNWARVVSS